MQRNIRVVFLLSFLKNSWFWIGVWVFYYLRFTNYAGIGLIETIQIVVITFSEVPTGLVADFFGKKRTLILSFILQTIGTLFLAFLPHLSWVIVGVIIAGIGGSFYSGTLEALVYDSLKEMNQERKYSKEIATINTLALVAPALCGVIGGFLYVVQPNLPFILSAVATFISIFIAGFLIEPKFKEKVLSFDSFFKQTRLGLHQLFKTKFLIQQTLLLVATGAVSVICLQMLNDFLGVEFGFHPTQLAILWSALYIACAFVSQATYYLRKYVSYEKLAVATGVIIALTLIVSPLVGIFLGGVSLAIRACLQTMNDNVSSVLINESIESEYRATTLSSFNLLKNIPYVALAYFLGSFADHFSAVKTAGVLGVVLLFVIIFQTVVYLKHKAAKKA